MSSRPTKSKPTLPKGFINLQDQYFNNVMDLRTASRIPNPQRKIGEGRRLEYSKSFTQGHSKMMFRYFTLESLFLLVCLTASLLILPLILPPLPPPPFMLLFLPLCMLGLLMVLAFMPSNARDATYNAYT